ncbi:MAG: hypothetical protein GWN61_23140, partial [candidate division Zixibacteria bacterium]|nr:hypothetical protein [candidate division Zixibacteria bacterium]NIV08989.1 hypothetical protein [candidate division Zixibacteria bacterium]
QSINKAGIELLVLPIPSSIKAQAKAFIDVFVDSTATGMGGVLLIIFTTGLGFTVGNVSLIVIGLIILWVYFLTCVHREYIHSFRLAIEKRTIDPDELSVNPEDASIFESLVKVL